MLICGLMLATSGVCWAKTPAQEMIAARKNIEKLEAEQLPENAEALMNQAESALARAEEGLGESVPKELRSRFDAVVKRVVSSEHSQPSPPPSPSNNVRFADPLESPRRHLDFEGEGGTPSSPRPSLHSSVPAPLPGNVSVASSMMHFEDLEYLQAARTLFEKSKKKLHSIANQYWQNRQWLQAQWIEVMVKDVHGALLGALSLDPRGLLHAEKKIKKLTDIVAQTRIKIGEFSKIFKMILEKTTPVSVTENHRERRIILELFATEFPRLNADFRFLQFDDASLDIKYRLLYPPPPYNASYNQSAFV